MAGYLPYGLVSGAGEVAVIESPNGGWNAIYSDRRTAGGVATVEGHDQEFANRLAHLFVAKSKEGVNPGDLFGTLCWKFKAERIEIYNNLSTLCLLTGYGEPLPDEE